MRTFRIIGFLGALILTAALGIGLILAGAGVLSLASIWEWLDSVTGSILVILVGAALVLVGIHFLIALGDERVHGARFRSEGDWGRVDLSPTAIREFISEILQQQIGIDRFRVLLRHEGRGVGITVRTTLSPEQRVTDIAERIQRELAYHVADRTGVEVTDVTVFVRGIRNIDRELKEMET